MIDAANLTKDQRSVLMYAETCIVDQGGLMDGRRMNAQDHEALKEFEAAGFLTYGRIPSSHLGQSGFSWTPTHWVRFDDAGWILAHAMRIKRSEQVGPYARSVFEAVAERAAR